MASESIAHEAEGLMGYWLSQSPFGEYKVEQNRCRELGVLPKFHSKAFLKIHEYPSADDFEGKKRLHGV